MKLGGWITTFGALLATWLGVRKSQALTPPSWPETDGGWPDDADVDVDVDVDVEPEPTLRSPLVYISAAERDRRFGPLTYRAAPTSSNPEAIVITNGFESNLTTESFPLIGRVRIHRKAAPSLRAALGEIESRGLGSLVRSFEGSYNPRFVRKSQTTLSSHAYATSIDVNAGSNPQGSPPTAEQSALAPIFERHGWYWGDRFRPTRDPMHFEFIGTAGSAGSG